MCSRRNSLFGCCCPSASGETSWSDSTRWNKCIMIVACVITRATAPPRRSLWSPMHALAVATDSADLASPT